MCITKIRTAGGTILAIASLFFVFGATDASASSGSIVQTASSTFVITSTQNLDSVISGNGFHFNMYQGSYPATSTLVAGQLTPFNYPLPVGDLALSACLSRTEFTITCNPEIHANTDGDYWLSFKYPGGQQQWYNFTKTGNTWTANTDPSSVETRLLDVSVSGNATTTLFDISYYLNLPEINSSNRPDTLNLRLTNRETTQLNNVQKLILPLTQGESTTTISMRGDLQNDPLPDGDYSAWINFWNFANQNFTFSASSITVNFTISGGLVTTYEIVEMSDALVYRQPDPYVEEPCGITAIGGCIKNAFASLFYPSTDAVESFTDLYDTLSTKFPFAYFTDFNDSILAVYTNPTTASGSLTIPFGTFGNLSLISYDQLVAVPWANEIRTILGAIIWLLTAGTIYRRTQQIFNQQQT